MANINLLPWREELRSRRQKQFVVSAVVAALLMVGVVGAVHWEFQKRIDFQTERNMYLEQQIALLDKKIKEIKSIEDEKRDLIARMEIIEALQLSRPEIVHLVEELSKSVPEGIYYSEVAQKGRRIDVKGVAQSNARVSSFMRNIDKSEWLEKPNLVEIKKQRQGPGEDVRLSDFTLRFQQIDPKKGSEEEDKSS